jgi:hypothetical protein
LPAATSVKDSSQHWICGIALGKIAQRAKSSRMSEPTEDQKKQIYDNLSADQKSKQTYTEWVKEVYHNQYEKWMPWIEDKYLALFGKDNKASYVTKGTWLKSPPFSLSISRFVSKHTGINASTRYT